MTIKHLKLHHFPGSRSGRVKWLLHELFDDGFETEIVDIYSGEQYRPEFLEKNPNHGVPILEVEFESGEKTVMTESAAMIAWLADAVPDKGLAPPVGLSPARADYMQMLHFASGWWDMMLWQVRAHEHILPEGQRDARTIERYCDKVRGEVEPQLLDRLSKGEFMCGAQFTAADIVTTHNVMWARLYGLCQDEAFHAYLSRLSKRRAFLKGFADARQFDPQPPKDSPMMARFTG